MDDSHNNKTVKKVVRQETTYNINDGFFEILNLRKVTKMQKYIYIYITFIYVYITWMSLPYATL